MSRPATSRPERLRRGHCRICASSRERGALGTGGRCFCEPLPACRRSIGMAIVLFRLLEGRPSLEAVSEAVFARQANRSLLLRWWNKTIGAWLAFHGAALEAQCTRRSALQSSTPFPNTMRRQDRTKRHAVFSLELQRRGLRRALQRWGI